MLLFKPVFFRLSAGARSSVYSGPVHNTLAAPLFAQLNQFSPALSWSTSNVFSPQCLPLTKLNDSASVSCLLLFPLRVGVRPSPCGRPTAGTEPGEERVGMPKTPLSEYSVITPHQPGAVLGTGRSGMNEMLLPSR